MIDVSDLQKTHHMGDVEVRALRGVTLRIEAGEFVAIMGPSGSGKSTLMHVLGLLDAPDAGSYKLFDRDVSKLSEDELAQVRSREVGFVFQQFNLLSRTTALENVSLPQLYSGSATDDTWPRELLEKVGLGNRLGHKPNELSGGQQQRIAIARSLVNKPRVIFADEPTGNLDSASEKEIMTILQRLNLEQGITIILVTHEPEISQYARRVIRMRDGVVQTDERLAPEPPRKSLSDAGSMLAASPSRKVLVVEAISHVKQAFRALLANKVRTGLSMLGILIGVAAVIAMLALGTGAQKSLEKELSSLGSNLLVLRSGSRRAGGVSMESGAGTRFTKDHADYFAESVPDIRQVAPSVTGRAQVVFGNKNWNTQVQGTTPAYETMRAAKPIAGRFFTEDEERQRARVALIGLTVVRELFGEQNPIGESIKINRVSFQIIGVLPEKGANGFRDQDDIILVPLSTAMRRLLGKEYVDSIDIEANAGADLDSVQTNLRAAVVQRLRLPANQQESFDIRNMAEIQAALSQTSKTMSVLLASIAAISLLVGGIGIMNIMLVSVTERTREIGLRKAIGAKRRDILSQFLIESMVVSFLGGATGIILGGATAWGMSAIAGWTVTVSPSSVILASGFSIGVGVLFGFWPAKKASALNPIEALRWE